MGMEVDFISHIHTPMKSRVMYYIGLYNPAKIYTNILFSDI